MPETTPAQSDAARGVNVIRRSGILGARGFGRSSRAVEVARPGCAVGRQRSPAGARPDVLGRAREAGGLGVAALRGPHRGEAGEALGDAAFVGVLFERARTLEEE